MNLTDLMNALRVIYSIIVIEIFDAKVVYTIFPRVYTSRHYGNSRIYQYCLKRFSFVENYIFNKLIYTNS